MKLRKKTVSKILVLALMFQCFSFTAIYAEPERSNDNIVYSNHYIKVDKSSSEDAAEKEQAILEKYPQLKKQTSEQPEIINENLDRNIADADTYISDSELVVVYNQLDVIEKIIDDAESVTLDNEADDYDNNYATFSLSDEPVCSPAEFILADITSRLDGNGIDVKNVDFPALQNGMEDDVLVSLDEESMANGTPFSAFNDILMVTKGMPETSSDESEEITETIEIDRNAILFATVQLKNKADLYDAIAVLEDCNEVKFAEPVITFKTATEFNDPDAGGQWALAATDAYDIYSDTDVRTNIEKVTIAIIDTGVKLDHEDLADSILRNSNNEVIGYNFADNNSVVTDDHGHGTHVTGIAAAISDNGKGIASIASGAKIMPIKAMNQHGQGSSSNIARGIMYAADNGADVINLSLGTQYDSFLVQEAINYAYYKGVLVVAATGNEYDKGSISYPAANDHVIPVASFSKSADGSFFESYFSNYSSDFADKIIHAPGERILSTTCTSSTSYDYKTGTSMASPYVAGMAAALKAKDIDCSLDSLERELYKQTISSERRYSVFDQFIGESSAVYKKLNYFGTDDGANNIVKRQGDVILQKHFGVTFASQDILFSEADNCFIASGNTQPEIEITAYDENGNVDTSERSVVINYRSVVQGYDNFSVAGTSFSTISSAMTDGTLTYPLDLSEFVKGEIVQIYVSDVSASGRYPYSDKVHLGLNNDIFVGVPVSFEVDFADGNEDPFYNKISLAYQYYTTASDIDSQKGTFIPVEYILTWDDTTNNYKGTLPISKGTYQFAFLQNDGLYQTYGNMGTKISIDKTYPNATPITGSIGEINLERLTLNSRTPLSTDGADESIFLELDNGTSNYAGFKVILEGANIYSAEGFYQDSEGYYTSQFLPCEYDSKTKTTTIYFASYMEAISISSEDFALKKTGIYGTLSESNSVIVEIADLPKDYFISPIFINTTTANVSSFFIAENAFYQFHLPDVQTYVEYYMSPRYNGTYASYGIYHAPSKAFTPIAKNDTNMVSTASTINSTPITMKPIKISSSMKTQDAKENRQALVVGDSKTGRIQYCDDIDSYTFKSLKGSDYSIDFTSGTPCAVRLYDYSNSRRGSCITTVVCDGTTAVDIKETLAAGTYEVEIMPFFEMLPGILSGSFLADEYTLQVTNVNGNSQDKEETGTDTGGGGLGSVVEEKSSIEVNLVTDANGKTTAKATVTSEISNNIKNGNVVINMVKNTAKADTLEISIDADTAKKILTSSWEVKSSLVDFVIPKNSFEEGKAIKIIIDQTDASVDKASANFSDLSFASNIYDITFTVGGKKVTEFKKAISVALPYDKENVTNTDNLSAYWFNETEKQWESKGGEISGSKVQFDTTHFSKYAVAEKAQVGITSFSDVASHWAKEEILKMSGLGIVNGYKGAFKPDDIVTRAEFTAFVVRMLNIEVKSSSSPFSDVNSGDWYIDIVTTAYNEKLISGFDGKFLPNDKITREEMAVIIINAYNYAKKTEETLHSSAATGFADYDSISSWAVEPIGIASDLKILKGNPDLSYRPGNSATRAEAITAISNLYTVIF